MTKSSNHPLVSAILNYLKSPDDDYIVFSSAEIVGNGLQVSNEFKDIDCLSLFCDELYRTIAYVARDAIYQNYIEEQLEVS
jgi:hypothetical protein